MIGGEYIIDQGYEAYTREEHDVWRTLYARQRKLLPGRAVDEFITNDVLILLLSIYIY